MFAAQAGAKHVYGIDMSDIITDAREIVRKNGFESKITLIQGKVEEIKLPVRCTSTPRSPFQTHTSQLSDVLEERVHRCRWKEEKAFYTEAGALFTQGYCSIMNARA